MATLPSPTDLTSSSTTNAQQKTNFTNLSNFLSDLFGTDSSVANNSSKVKGLIGGVNSTTPLTKFDLSAAEVVFKSSGTRTVAKYNTGTLTCDLGLAGPAANGRDRAAAFTANTFVYLYFIHNGSTVATLASPTGPNSFNGSTLPSGYTHWAFATAVRWNASSNIVNSYVRGNRVEYLQALVALASNPATATTAVNLTTLLPPEAETAIMGHTAALDSNGGGGGYAQSALLLQTGLINRIMDIRTGGASQSAFQATQVEVLNISQTVYFYNQSFSNVATATTSLLFYGYTLPNGD